MTTPCELVQIEYQGNGTVNVFAFPFPYDFKTEVKVALWNNTTKKHVDILTTDATYPWEVNDANPTAVTFTGTVPPAPPASDVNEDPIFNVRIYRVTDMTDIRSVFNQGSAIRATDLNKNFEQLRYAIQEGKCQIPDKLLEYLDEYYWNNYSDVVYSNETWVSNNQTIATTAALDARFQDEANETIISSETWVADDDKIATTQSLENRFDTLIETDILVDATGLTKSASGGQTTVGIGANSVDLDRIKTADIVQTSAYSSTWTNVDNKVATVGALAARLDAVVSTSQPTTLQTGKFWYNPTEGINALYMWNGTVWKVLTSGTPYIPAGTTIVRYVDQVNGSDDVNNLGFLPQSPLKTIKRAITLINASASGDGTLVVVEPGVYQEALPLTIQKNNISVVGKSLRSCFIHPTVATENSNMWEVDSGTYISGFTMLGLKVPNSDQGSRNNAVDNDATYGLPSNQPFAVSFRSGNPVILKSPYVQNCTHFSDAQFDNANFDPNTFPSTDAQTYSAVAGDKTSAPCGGGLLVDGSVPATTSPIRSMVVDAFTQITLDGPGILVTNNGYAQLVSFFGTFCHYHAKAKNGGQINLSNCVTDFGRYGLIAEGKSPTAIAAATASAASSGATTVTIGAITSAGSFHGTVSRPLDHMMLTVDGNDYGVVSSVANGSGWNVTITPALSQTISNTAVTFALRSYISTGGHTFEYVGVGTDYSDHPDNGGVAIEANQVKQLSGGKVWQSSTDHIGKFKAGSVLTVDQIAETLAVNGSITVTGTNAVNGNITVTGTVDGRDVATDGTKLDGIETGATADQTAAEIRTLVEAATDSNVFTDADHTKLNGIEASADVTDATNVNAAGAVMNSDASTASMSFVADEDNMSSNSSTKVPTQQSVKAYVDAEVAGVVDSAPGALDTLNELAAALGDDANFSTTVTNSIATKLPLAGGTITGNIVMSGSQTVDGRDLSADGSKLDGIATGATAYANSNVDAHLNQSTASSGELLSWNGSDYDWIAAASGGLANNATGTNSLGIGTNALNSETSGSINIAFGGQALDATTTGYNNVATGYQALKANVGGYNNTATGRSSLQANTGGYHNTAFGYLAGGGIIDGHSNTTIGAQAGDNITTGDNNIVIGNSADASSATVNNEITLGNTNISSLRIPGLQNGAANGSVLTYNSSNGNIDLVASAGLTNNATYVQSLGVGTGALDSESASGFRNTAFGFNAGTSVTDGTYNVLIGGQAGDAITTGASNVAVGYDALSGLTTGSSNTAIGHECMQLVAAGASNNTAVGRGASQNITTGSENASLGSSAGAFTTTGIKNIAVGSGALMFNTTGSYNTASGYQALYATTTGSNNTATGYQALDSNTTGTNNVAVGSLALTTSTTASNNVAIGYTSQHSTTTGTSNISIGHASMEDNTTGNFNVACGQESIKSNSTGSNNTATGHQSLYANTTGFRNTAAGHTALKNNEAGTQNSAYGYGALYTNTNGVQNTGIGHTALYFNTGDQNTALGWYAGNNITTGDNNIVLGYNATASSATVSNEITLGNASISSLRIPGLQSGAANGSVLTYNSSNGNIDLVAASGLSNNTTNTGSIGIGANALDSDTTGVKNIAIGSGALTDLTDGANNIAIGDNAGRNIIGGTLNIAIGTESLDAATTASRNIAVGVDSLKGLTTADSNVAIGYQSGERITTGGFNVSIGRGSLNQNTTSFRNIAVGWNSLNNTTASDNTAIGALALYSDTTGSHNTACGSGTLYSNTTGQLNVGVGSSTLYNNTTGSNNVATGYTALMNNTTGHSNTANGDGAALGVTTGHSNVAVGFSSMRNSTTANNNTCLGYESGHGLTTGSDNVAIGQYAGRSFGNAGSCTAVGHYTLMNCNQDGNTAIGERAGHSVTTGENNTFIGRHAGLSTTTVSSLVAVGYRALQSNTTGAHNIASGYQALYANTTGSNNAAYGPGTLQSNTTGGYNTAIGCQSGQNITTGQYNLIVGSNNIGSSITTGSYNVLLCGQYGNTSGSYNTFVGGKPGYSTSGNSNIIVGAGSGWTGYATNGSSNVIIGDYAGYSVNGADNVIIGKDAGYSVSGSNNVIIGNDAAASSSSVSNEITLGHTSIATLRCNTQTISSLSDGRDKAEVTELPEGLEFISSLNPVKFKWQTRDGNSKDGTYEAGFIAQDLQSAQSTSNADYLGLVMDENPERLEASYGKLVPMLVKAIQELKFEVEQLKANA